MQAPQVVRVQLVAMEEVQDGLVEQGIAEQGIAEPLAAMALAERALALELHCLELSRPVVEEAPMNFQTLPRYSALLVLVEEAQLELAAQPPTRS